MDKKSDFSRIILTCTVLLLVSLAAYCIVKALGRHRALKSQEFQLQVSLPGAGSGYILLAPYVPTKPRFSYLVIIDPAGKVFLKRKAAGIVSDFRQWLVDGKTRYSYAVYDPDNDPGDYVHGSSAHVVILDAAFKEMKQVRLMPHGGVAVDKNKGIDHHDFIMCSDGHFITISSYVKQVTNVPAHLSPARRLRVAAPIIQEIKNDSVVWQWDGSDFPEFYESSTKGNKFSDSANVQDYMHVNAVTIDPNDSNLVVSFHNTSQVIKIDRHSGGIVWRLGGRNSDFPLSAEQIFLRQHHPTFIDSGHTLLLLDNGDSLTRPRSRVVEFKLDEQAKKVTVFRSYDVPGPFAESKGSVQLVGNNYFICGGSANYLLEVDRETGAKKMEIHYNQTSFRAYRVQDVPGITLLKDRN